MLYMYSNAIHVYHISAMIIKKLIHKSTPSKIIQHECLSKTVTFTSECSYLYNGHPLDNTEPKSRESPTSTSHSVRDTQGKQETNPVKQK